MLELRGQHRALRALHRGGLRPAVPAALHQGHVVREVTHRVRRAHGVNHRLGEALAGDRTRLLDNLYMGYVDPPTAAIRIGLRALRRIEELRAPYNSFFAESRPLLYRWSQETPGVSALCSGLGLTIFARLENLDASGVHRSGPTDTMAFSKFAAKHFEVAVTPGEFFGVPGCLRLGFGTPKEHLEGALRQLTLALEAWRAK